ncbi:uncharacterized protein LOC8042667 isoform X1 [Ixodes scapularis]|uniref:uncharacterized protein LOC8042667 isoform X1 n=1 Tax=Ixodes scapularis TaxID=6945 RepID=UPI001A9F2BFB|nr:uncharacterized protein LOC8042667 isoform X1 [Ixodes scapularis]
MERSSPGTSESSLILKDSLSGEPAKYGSVEVANNHAGDTLALAPPDTRAAGDFGAGGDMELVRNVGGASAGPNGTATESPKRCTCAAGGPKCTECIAIGRGAVKVQMESWSPQKTTVFGVILVAFVIWAVVFGVCLSVFKL